MARPFSACIMISPPFLAVRCMARKIAPSSLKKTPGYAVNNLKVVTPSSTRLSARLVASALTMVPPLISVRIRLLSAGSGLVHPRRVGQTHQEPVRAQNPRHGLAPGFLGRFLQEPMASLRHLGSCRRDSVRGLEAEPEPGARRPAVLRPDSGPSAGMTTLRARPERGAGP